ncbi:hypothetical protein FRB97_006706 [Tulasnella sp. 331]|nr:hypothetical protein FRB97_006706 [Tulasnella sp. 331]
MQSKVDDANKLVQSAEEFFAQPQEEKLALHVEKGGVAWRGYMPHGGEGTHARIDHKEGLCAGPEHPDDHIHTGMPLHGTNQFLDSAIPVMCPTVLKYIEDGYIRDHYLQPEPVALFRCFKYSINAAGELSNANGQAYGIGERTGGTTRFPYTAPK